MGNNDPATQRRVPEHHTPQTRWCKVSKFNT